MLSSTRPQFGWSEVFDACAFGDVAYAKKFVVKNVLENRLKVRPLTRASSQNGETLLHISCRNGHVEIARLLLELGANIHVSN